MCFICKNLYFVNLIYYVADKKLGPGVHEAYNVLLIPWTQIKSRLIHVIGLRI